MSVEVGQAAPEFTLTNQYGQQVSLSDYRGEKNVVLMFYPAAFTGTLHQRAVQPCAIAHRSSTATTPSSSASPAIGCPR